MPRDGAIIFSDLIGKLDLIRVACDKCGVMAVMVCFALSISGVVMPMIDWLGELTADCPKKQARI